MLVFLKWPSLVRRGSEIAEVSERFRGLTGRLQKLLGRDHRLRREKVKSTQLPAGPLGTRHIPALESIVSEKKEQKAKRHAAREAAGEK